MSFRTMIEGEADRILEELEAKGQQLIGNVGFVVHAAARDVVRAIRSQFHLVGATGKRLSVKVEADGHFDANGQGYATVKLTSSVNEAEKPPEKVT